MSLCIRKPTIQVSDQVRQTSLCTVSEKAEKLEISDLSRRRIVLSDAAAQL